MENQSILYPIFNEIPNFEFPKPHLFAYSRIPKRWVGCYSKFISCRKFRSYLKYPIQVNFHWHRIITRERTTAIRRPTIGNPSCSKTRREEAKGVSTILKLIWLSGARQSSPRNQNESFFSGSKAANDSRDQNSPPSLKLNPTPDVRPAAK